MAFDGAEILIVVGIIAVIFLWAPNKIPAFARSLGQAKREFDKAAHGGNADTPASTPKDKSD